MVQNKNLKNFLGPVAPLPLNPYLVWVRFIAKHVYFKYTTITKLLKNTYKLSKNTQKYTPKINPNAQKYTKK